MSERFILATVWWNTQTENGYPETVISTETAKRLRSLTAADRQRIADEATVDLVATLESYDATPEH